MTNPVNTNIASAIASQSATIGLPRSPISSTPMANIRLNTTSGSTSLSAAALITLVGTTLIRCCCGVSFAALAAMSCAALSVWVGRFTPAPGCATLTAAEADEQRDRRHDEEVADRAQAEPAELAEVARAATPTTSIATISGATMHLTRFRKILLGTSSHASTFALAPVSWTQMPTAMPTTSPTRIHVVLEFIAATSRGRGV
jgi:hypothetical protein